MKDWELKTDPWGEHVGLELNRGDINIWLTTYDGHTCVQLSKEEATLLVGALVTMLGGASTPDPDTRSDLPNPRGQCED